MSVMTKKDGRKQWMQDGLLHRVDGPAVINRNGKKEWWLHGNRHRTDGPALSEPHDQWYVEGYLVDVTRWYVNVLQDDTSPYNTPGLNGHRDALQRNYPNVESLSLHAAFTHIKANLSADMLHDFDRHVAAIAAWHLPVDDDYISAAFEQPVVRTIMAHRHDVPEDARTLMHVAA